MAQYSLLHPLAFFESVCACVFSTSADGSSSVQTLGGMAGAIVVEDPEGSLPPAWEAMREVVMVMQETNLESGETTRANIVHVYV